MRRKAFKTTELKMPDIVGLQILTQRLSHLMKRQTVDISMGDTDPKLIKVYGNPNYT
jgi:hypothetical protein